MKPLKMGVLGVSGHFEKRVITPLLKSDKVEVYAIASRSGDKAKIFAEKYNIPVFYSSYQELVNDRNIDFVFIPLPNHLHGEWIKKAADAGKHIICEKPIAMTAAEAQDSVSYAHSKGVSVMEAFMYRFHPQWRHAYELVRTGELGKILAIQTFFGYSNTDPGNIRNMADIGGGAILDIGCYAVSTARFLLNAEPCRVISLVKRDGNFGTDVLTSGILDFGEARALFTVSTQIFPGQKVYIYGTGGQMTVEVPFNMPADVPARLVVKTDVETREILVKPEDQYGIEFEQFADSIADKKPVPVSPEDSINNMKVLDALFVSEKSGGWENIR